MPELPECYVIAEELNKRFSGNLIYSSTVVQSYLSKIKPSKSYPCELDKLYPIYVEKIHSRCKRILIEGKINSGHPVVIVVFLSMEGSFRFEIGTHPKIEFNMCKVGEGINILSKFYYDDMLEWGTFTICLTGDDYKTCMKNLGPDLYQDSVTLEQYKSVIKSDKITDKQIAWFIMEPKFFSGCGNYIKAEILYLCRIAPYRTLGSLSDTDVNNLFNNTIRVIKESLASGGLTTRTYWSPSGRKGLYQPRVYGRDFDDNRFPVRRDKFTDNRTTHWVDKIQV